VGSSLFSREAPASPRKLCWLVSVPKSPAWTDSSSTQATKQPEASMHAPNSKSETVLARCSAVHCQATKVGFSSSVALHSNLVINFPRSGSRSGSSLWMAQSYVFSPVGIGGHVLGMCDTWNSARQAQCSTCWEIETSCFGRCRILSLFCENPDFVACVSRAKSLKSEFWEWLWKYEPCKSSFGRLTC